MEATLELYARATLVVAAIAGHRSLRQWLTLDQPGRPFLTIPLVATAVALLLLYVASVGGVVEMAASAQFGVVGAFLVLASGLLRPERNVWAAKVQRDTVTRDLLRDRSGTPGFALSALPRSTSPVSLPAGPELILQEGQPLRGKPSSSEPLVADVSGVQPAVGSRLVTPNPDA